MTNQKVSFIELTQQEYDDSMKHSDAAFYYTSDTHKFYKGDNEIGADGGSNEFVVNYTTEDYSTFTADKTYAEILEAIEAGKNVIAYFNDSYFTLTGNYGGESGIYFSCVNVGSSITAYGFNHWENGIEHYEYEIQATPIS